MTHLFLTDGQYPIVVHFDKLSTHYSIDFIIYLTDERAVESAAAKVVVYSFAPDDLTYSTPSISYSHKLPHFKEPNSDVEQLIREAIQLKEGTFDFGPPLTKACSGAEW